MKKMNVNVLYCKWNTSGEEGFDILGTYENYEDARKVLLSELTEDLKTYPELTYSETNIQNDVNIFYQIFHNNYSNFRWIHLRHSEDIFDDDLYIEYSIVEFELQ